MKISVYSERTNSDIVIDLDNNLLIDDAAWFDQYWNDVRWTQEWWNNYNTWTQVQWADYGNGWNNF